MNLVVRRGLWLLLPFFVAAGLWRLRLDVQVLNLLPPELPSVQGLRLYEDHFANANELVISLQGTNSIALESAARSLAIDLRAATNLVAEAVWTPPWSEHPAEMTEFLAYLWLNQPEPDVHGLVERLKSENLAAELEETKRQLATSLSPDELARLGYDPFKLMQLPNHDGSVPGFGEGDDLFASKDGTFRILFVHSRTSLRNYRASQEWLNQIRAIVEPWREKKHLGLTIKYTGRPAFVSEISGSMEWDIGTSTGGTLLIIAGLFWWAHRRFRPLLWLLSLLLVILLITLSLGGLIFHTLNVISIGFAAILLGLAVDYGLVLYQEWALFPGKTRREITALVGPGIIWASISTAGAFFILNLGGLPGLAQLGTLVGIGVLVAAAVMLNFYLRPFEISGAQNAGITTAHPQGSQPGNKPSFISQARQEARFGWSITIVLLAAGTWILLNSPPSVDFSSEALRPASSAAYATVEEIKTRMDRPREPLWLIVPGTSFDHIAERLEIAEKALARAQENGLIERVTLPGPIVPRPVRQQRNRELLARISQNVAQFEEAAVQAGFTAESLELTRRIFRVWEKAASSPLPYMPQEMAGRWILERLLSMDPGTFLALGLIHPSQGVSIGEIPARDEIQQAGMLVAGWELLGQEIFGVIRKNFLVILILMSTLVLVCLWLAFKRVISVLLSLAAVGVAGLLLATIMYLAGWEWNLMNLMAAPLLVGAGLDYSIHVQLALFRHGGDARAMRSSVGRALFLCAATTVAGFGSLSWAGNPGLGSLGKICAAGIFSAWFAAVWLLPVWWSSTVGRKSMRPLE